MSRYEESLALQITALGLPKPKRQFRFADDLGRQYRVDFAWPAIALVVEVDGGAFVGRGGRGALMSRTAPIGYHQTVDDYRKRNLLALLGYQVLAFQPQQIERGEALRAIHLAIQKGAGSSPEHRQDWWERLRAHVDRQAIDDRTRRRIRERRTALRRKAG